MIEALYLHIPFCVKRCSYCDFATEVCHDDRRMDDYVDALSLAVRRASRGGLLGGIKTIYIGGGTPSYLGSRRLNSLVYLISLSVNLENVEEFTVEANPDSIDERMVKDLFALGVDRFSVGAQSFDDNVLGTFGRVHTAGQIGQAAQAIRTRCDNLSLDLICGAPGQTMESWQQSLEQAVSLGARHLSVYPLALEEGTPLACAVACGEQPAPDDGVEADMMLRAAEVLERAGMRRYEVASYAYPGFESRHNSSYWTGVEYLGLGAGAASMLTPGDAEACRRAGLCGEAEVGDEIMRPQDPPARIRAYADTDTSAFIESGGRPVVRLERLGARAALVEDLMLGMRLSRGLSDAQVSDATPVVPELPATMRHLADEGLVAHDDGFWHCTTRGWLCGNEVFGAIWNLA